MATRRRSREEPLATRRPPATTPMGRELQLISQAVDLAERQLSEGTASAQVITHYLKLGSSREILEQERIRQEVDLLKAKAELMASQQLRDEMYAEALNAMRAYNGQEPLEKTE